MDPHADTEDAQLSAIVKTQAERHAAPAVLRERIVTAIRQGDAQSQQEHKSWQWRQWLNIGAAFAMGIVTSVTAIHFFTALDAQQRLAQEVVASHVRSLMATHLADVASSDSHTVKPWFAGKLDFSPPVHDLAAQGFPLIGGRLDYIDGRPVAALIYQHRQHTINVFVWPRDDHSPAPLVSFAVHGFNGTSWKDETMQYWLVSDTSAEELQQFAQRLRDAKS